ncbi:MAG: hypothetical protein ACRC8Y_04880 [Chroococcales cyanobacterium]
MLFQPQTPPQSFTIISSDSLSGLFVVTTCCRSLILVRSNDLLSFSYLSS